MAELTLRKPGSSDQIDKVALADELHRRVEAMLPRIRARAMADEEAGQVSADTIGELEDAGVFEMLVPRRYGGHGLGLAAFYQVTRLLAGGDMATAWVASFIIAHNWWAARLPIAAQQELFADRTHVKIATAQSPTATAERAPGGFRVSGRYPYSSAILHSGWCIYPASLADELAPMMFLIPVDDVKILDDWKVTAMAATGSRTGVVEDVFVPEHRAISSWSYFGSNHPGIVHEEPIYRARLVESIRMQMAALSLGGAEAMVELGRERLFTSAPLGTKRIEREPSRIRWAQAMQKVRAARFIYEAGVSHTVAKETSGEPWSDEEVGQNELDMLTIMHMCKEAVQMLVDGAGSSAFQRDYPMQRYLRDIQMISTNVQASDFDVVAERASRLVLGLGRRLTDPPAVP